MRLLTNYSTYCPTSTPSGSSPAEFKPQTEDEIIETIKSMPTKPCESDAIPSQVLKGVLPLIITPLTTVINLALGEGIFTESWKVAIIHPLIKKFGLKLVNSYYRPVSNLHYLSKMVEKCLLKQFNIHCDNNNLLPDY